MQWDILVRSTQQIRKSLMGFRAHLGVWVEGVRFRVYGKAFEFAGFRDPGPRGCSFGVVAVAFSGTKSERHTVSCQRSQIKLVSYALNPKP